MSPVALHVASLVALFAVMGAAWATQRATGNVGWVDVFWTLGTGTVGVALALWSFAPETGPTGRQILVALLAAIWSLRLGLYVAYRVATGPEDSRYRALRSTWAADFQRRLFWFAMAQAPCGFILAVAIEVAARNPAPLGRPLDLLGIAVLLVAILGEATADRQLQRFIAERGGGGVCDRGLWSLSRHPNYFFEWLGWVAYPLLAIDLSGAYPWGWLALGAPVVMYLVLVHGTGVPPLEEHMRRSRGAAFEAYARRTNVFWPGPPRAGTN
jgi:steroid 5-alpha reductase family enzyme